ncbi:unnamed protein product [Camellia sinensis]
MAAVAHSFCRSIDVYDQDIHLQTLLTLWYPSSLSFMQSLCNGNDSSILAVTEGYMVLLEISSMKSVVLQLVLQWEELIVLLSSTILADG